MEPSSRIFKKNDEETGRPKAAPKDQAAFACRCVGLFDLRLANDDLGAVEREILVLGATALVRSACNKPELSGWMNALLARRSFAT
jgi:hypothetical protein